MSQILTKISNISNAYDNKISSNFKYHELEKLLIKTDEIILPVLKELIQKYVEKSIWDQLEYSLINKAHFDRAFFVRLGCEAVGGNISEILPAMASVEFRYASGTAIDDVFDKNTVRMGKSSMPKKYGENSALSFGSILKSLSSISLLSLFEKIDIDPKAFIDINIKDEFTHYQVYLGQIADLRSETIQIEDITDSFYLDMIKNSTGVDAGYCFELGCLLGGGSKEQQNYFYEFGVSLGTAMQIRDDLLDYVNNRELINKEPFRDFETNKKRLPIILAYRFGNSEIKKMIKSLLKKEILSEDDKEKLSSIINNEFILGYINKLKNKLLETAKENFTKINATQKVLSIIEQILQQINV